ERTQPLHERSFSFLLLLLRQLELLAGDYGAENELVIGFGHRGIASLALTGMYELDRLERLRIVPEHLILRERAHGIPSELGGQAREPFLIGSPLQGEHRVGIPQVQFMVAENALSDQERSPSESGPGDCQVPVRSQ